MKTTQKKAILEHLKRMPITPLEALKYYGCFRLADVVFRLKKEGYDIITNIVGDVDGKHYAEYHIRQIQNTEDVK